MSDTSSPLFSQLPTFAGDPIFELAKTCRRDPRPEKVDLTVGMYYDESGRIPVLGCVQAAESVLAAQLRPRTYLPIEGLASYREAVQHLVFGEASVALKDARVVTIQSLGGTGALKVGADFLKDAYPDSEVWISDPAWSNHFAVFEGAGIRTHAYPYYDSTRHQVLFEPMMALFSQLPARSILLMHGCCHNPSGADLTHEQWCALADLAQQRGLILFVDLAYQGFGSGLDEDAQAVRMLAERGTAFLVANSFSKNFSFYAERCGALSVVCEQAAQADRVMGQLVAIIRRTYSNPPLHGAQVIAQVLTDPALAAQWQDDVAAMRARIRAMRTQARQLLAEKAPGYAADYLIDQHGMFGLTGLPKAQILALRDRYGIYMLDSGRMCVPGLNLRNLDYFTTALARVVTA